MPAAFDPVRDSVQSPTSETDRPQSRRPSRSASIADVLNHDDADGIAARSLSSSSGGQGASSSNVGSLRAAYSPPSSMTKLPPTIASPTSYSAHLPHSSGNGGPSQMPPLRNQRSPSLQHLLNSGPSPGHSAMAGPSGPSSPGSVDGYYAPPAHARGRGMSMSSDDQGGHSQLRVDSSDIPPDYHHRTSPGFAGQRPPMGSSPTSHFAIPEVPNRSPESIRSRLSIHRLSQSPGTVPVPLPPHHIPSPQHSYSMGPPPALPPPLPSPHSQYSQPLASPHSLPSPHTQQPPLPPPHQYPAYGHAHAPPQSPAGPGTPIYAHHPRSHPPPSQQLPSPYHHGPSLESPHAMPQTPEGSYYAPTPGHPGWSHTPSEGGSLNKSSVGHDGRSGAYFPAPLPAEYVGPSVNHASSSQPALPPANRPMERLEPSNSPPQAKKSRRESTRNEAMDKVQAEGLGADAQQQQQEQHRPPEELPASTSADPPPKRGRGRPPKQRVKEETSTEATETKQMRASVAEKEEKAMAKGLESDVKIEKDAAPELSKPVRGNLGPDKLLPIKNSAIPKEEESPKKEEPEDTKMEEVDDEVQNGNGPVQSDLAYAPKQRVSVPTVTRMPLTRAEVDQLRGSSQNPLRRKWLDENPGSSDGWEVMLARFASEEGGQLRAPKRKRESTTAVASLANGEGDAASLVAAHYNSRTDVGLNARRESPILPLRNFNNWVKSVLIGQFCQHGGKVLDLGGGKGGDLQKWEKGNISEYILADIAEVSVAQAQQRYEERRLRFRAKFYAFDCFSNPLADHIEPQVLQRGFTNVSLQFCMHYGWESVPKANLMLENIARYLEPGGHFVGTIPNCDELRRRLTALPDPASSEEEEANPTKGLKFGNDFYHVTFDPAQRDKKYKDPPFGHRYRFHLIDAVEGVDEYVVDWEQFLSLADQNGLECVYKKRFGEVWNDEGRTTRYSALARKMRVDVPSNDQQTFPPSMPPDLWEACDLYIAFAFQKKSRP